MSGLFLLFLCTEGGRRALADDLQKEESRQKTIVDKAR
jgi:hypothetical protein